VDEVVVIGDRVVELSGEAVHRGRRPGRVPVRTRDPVPGSLPRPLRAASAPAGEDERVRWPAPSVVRPSRQRGRSVVRTARPQGGDRGYRVVMRSVGARPPGAGVAPAFATVSASPVTTRRSLGISVPRDTGLPRNRTGTGVRRSTAPTPPCSSPAVGAGVGVFRSGVRPRPRYRSGL